MENIIPIGTRVIVFRLDGHSIVGEGVIEDWVSEIPEEHEEPLASTEMVGTQPEIEWDSVIVFTDDGQELSLEESLEELTLRIPKIKLDSGEITYGHLCFWKTVAEHQQSTNN